MITYSLDSNNTLVDVGGDWEAFALANHGDDLTRENVLGMPLFRFIVGAEVTMIYKALFTKVRNQQRPLSFIFRCDSLTCRRQMMIHIDPLPSLGLAVRTELLEDAQRDEVPLLEPGVPHTEEIIHICCICSDVQSTGNRWVPIEMESARRHLLECDAVPRLSHGYCPDCMENQLKLLE